MTDNEMGSEPLRDDPAYALPLPPGWALDAAAKNAGYKDWFSIPAFFRTPVNRRVIVEARRIVAKYGSDQLVAECRERAEYLKAMEPEGLSALEKQCMDTLFSAAGGIERLRGAVRLLSPECGLGCTAAACPYPNEQPSVRDMPCCVARRALRASTAKTSVSEG